MKVVDIGLCNGFMPQGIKNIIWTTIDPGVWRMKNNTHMKNNTLRSSQFHSRP